MVHLVHDPAGLRAMRGLEGDFAQLLRASALQVYRWDGQSRRADNGGTVLGIGETGRWLLCHDGTVCLSVFGISGPQAPADDALDALVSDPAVRCIRAACDLRLQRRHTFFRSGLRLDFGMHLLSAEGVEDAVHNDPFHALLHFCGRAEEASSFSVTLHADIPELYDALEVTDSARCPVGSWWRVSVDPLQGRAERELDKLLQVTPGP